MFHVEDPRLEYIAFLEEDTAYSAYRLAADPLFSLLFATTSL